MEQRISNLDRELRWYVTPTEAARLLGLGRSTMYQMVAAKTIRSIRIGRAVKVSVDALREWCKSREDLNAN
jgi:excisionase family DNA binding protein